MNEKQTTPNTPDSDVADVLRILVSRHHAQHHKQFPAESCPAWPCDLVRNAAASSPAPASPPPDNVLNMVWAENAGVSVWVYKDKRDDQRVIQIRKGEQVLASATIANHNRDDLAESISTGDLRYSPDEAATLVRAAIKGATAPAQPEGEQEDGYDYKAGWANLLRQRNEWLSWARVMLKRGDPTWEHLPATWSKCTACGKPCVASQPSPETAVGGEAQRFVTAAFAYLDTIAGGDICNDRTCIRCRIADAAFEVQRSSSGVSK